MNRTVTAAVAAAEETLSHRQGFWSKARRHRTLLFSGAILLVILLIAIFAPLLAPYDPFAQSIALRLKPPFWHDKTVADHLLGTDQLGRDYLSRLIYGARPTLLLAAVVTEVTDDHVLVPLVIDVGSFLVPVTMIAFALSRREAFLTFELGYSLPDRYIRVEQPAAAAPVQPLKWVSNCARSSKGELAAASAKSMMPETRS